ncbi:unnamed protein product [Cercospora beticola]|nr:unnamed protein product [Cercospora beticola]
MVVVGDHRSGVFRSHLVLVVLNRGLALEVQTVKRRTVRVCHFSAKPWRKIYKTPSIPSSLLGQNLNLRARPRCHATAGPMWDGKASTQTDFPIFGAYPTIH